MRRSLTIELIPFTLGETKTRLYVKTIDLDGDKWINTRYWIDVSVDVPTEAIPDEETLRWACDVAELAARVITKEDQERRYPDISETNARPSDTSVPS
jgi:hypothetical protein